MTRCCRRWWPTRWAKDVLPCPTLVLVRALGDGDLIETPRFHQWSYPCREDPSAAADQRAKVCRSCVRNNALRSEMCKGVMEMLAKLIECHDKTRATIARLEKDQTTLQLGIFRRAVSANVPAAFAIDRRPFRPIGRLPRSHCCHRIDTTRPYAWLREARRAIPGSC
jgi:hypothetical protein